MLYYIEVFYDDRVVGYLYVTEDELNNIKVSCVLLSIGVKDFKYVKYYVISHYLMREYLGKIVPFDYSKLRAFNANRSLNEDELKLVILIIQEAFDNQ